MGLASKLQEALGQINYKAFNIINTSILYGLPPVPIKEFDSIDVQPLAQRVKFVRSLAGHGGMFLDSKNLSAIVSLRVPQNSASSAMLELMQLTGVAWPLMILDRSTLGTSSIISPKARILNAPEWSRAEMPGLATVEFGCTSLAINGGIRRME